MASLAINLTSSRRLKRPSLGPTRGGAHPGTLTGTGTALEVWRRSAPELPAKLQRRLAKCEGTRPSVRRRRKVGGARGEELGMEPGLARVGAPGPEIHPEGVGEALAGPAKSGRGPLHILVLTDREWTHPQGGGTGTNLFGQVMRWLAWGHRVTVIACGYSGSLPVAHL